MPYHIFGDHSRCKDLLGPCDGNAPIEEENFVETIEKAGLLRPVEEAVAYLSCHADSLFYGATNNVALRLLILSSVSILVVNELILDSGADRIKLDAPQLRCNTILITWLAKST